MTEDFITPYFARDLAVRLSSAGATVFKSRTNEVPVHAPSGEQWWKIAARYYLQSQLPSETAIWNSPPTATHSLRERDEDIRSRPLYANHVGADHAIRLHTDGTDDTTVRGTRAYYQTGRTVDAQLASQILCSMKQAIQSVAGYERWRVAEAPYPADKGENRLAAMPSVIIELGFHSNAADALALQATSFRNAAVKGIERGITDYHAGTACSEFRITSIPPFSAPINSPMDMLVGFEGDPRFPITLRTRNVTCAQGWTCRPAILAYSTKQTSPIKRTLSCSGSSDKSGTFKYVAWLTDASGIRTKEVEYTYSCTANA
ncbi:N-acetylmuramoyl-L-alanine amidase [Lysobacter pythonis]|uniref:N-acetylmuramoyl-L-alanine amidase n=1 Tax=Solilutibacter pythonis TaxID=2483112 RepID=A0A3M2HVJ1_9GAMM|nr:N-acetylmuramoyl-L-alanine amidase [Lysobacter pythonis]RMH93761.1 N-acetylmuramoyl-L-alanine amidase [Lysobacter pythonis]